LTSNKDLVDGVNRFGWDLLVKLPGGNQLISPVGLGLSLGMLQRQAEGQTLKEINKVLHLPSVDPKTDPGWKTLSLFLKAKKPKRQVDLLNGLYLQTGYPIATEWKTEIVDWFSAQLETVDFQTNPVEAERQVNGWVEKRSRGTFKSLIPPGTFNDLTRMVLLNVIRFQGDWEHPFDPAQTQPGPFETKPNNPKTIPFLNKTDGHFRLVQNDKARALELPTFQQDRSVWILLPRKRHGLAELLETGSSQSLATLLQSRGSSVNIPVALPKFQMDARLGLNPILAELGMSRAFDPTQAELSRHSPGKNDLFLQAVIHQARFLMDEKGAKAEAATALVETKKSEPPRPPERFIADHPFLVAITDQTSGALLFLGKVEDPQTVSGTN